jgi:hypothetical protein
MRDKLIGYDRERLAFRFTMRADDESIDCQISDAALDQLAGMEGSESIVRQAQFLSLRGTIEKLASDIFDRRPRVKGQPVRIFRKDVLPGQSAEGQAGKFQEQHPKE